MDFSELDKLNIAFLIAALILLGFILIVSIWAIILQLEIFFTYSKNNKKHIGNGKTAKEVAEEMLKNLGYHDIKVVRASYLWFIFFRNWGNRYSPKRKKILLYGNILKKDTVTAVALATQKVGLVIQHKEGDKQMAFRAKWEFWTRISPNLLMPIVTIGLVLDLFVNGWVLEGNAFGVITLIFAIIAVAYTCISFRALYLIIPTERKAGQIALKIIKENNLIPEEYIHNVENMFHIYVKKYLCDFILAILQLLLDILRIAMGVSQAKAKK